MGVRMVIRKAGGYTLASMNEAVAQVQAAINLVHADRTKIPAILERTGRAVDLLVGIAQNAAAYTTDWERAQELRNSADRLRRNMALLTARPSDQSDVRFLRERLAALSKDAELVEHKARNILWVPETVQRTVRATLKKSGRRVRPRVR